MDRRQPEHIPEERHEISFFPPTLDSLFPIASLVLRRVRPDRALYEANRLTTVQDGARRPRTRNIPNGINLRHWVPLRDQRADAPSLPPDWPVGTDQGHQNFHFVPCTVKATASRKPRLDCRAGRRVARLRSRMSQPSPARLTCKCPFSGFPENRRPAARIRAGRAQLNLRSAAAGAAGRLAARGAGYQHRCRLMPATDLRRHAGRSGHRPVRAGSRHRRPAGPANAALELLTDPAGGPRSRSDRACRTLLHAGTNDRSVS